eukprot:CAMPEP_0118953440 /NCGR_PEP_ID=MMETSP1169-20130426/56566_1 /TAXON_ID=36882 /ORGANISM="Pyramimonas obovata, Strain CCMP722" /LENGTH=127 /DNA_ID=CAMNT_0006900889 /DNA_START=313 /DNA_END=697 /DNA_ORIENTATION=+
MKRSLLRAAIWLIQEIWGLESQRAPSQVGAAPSCGKDGGMPRPCPIRDTKTEGGITQQKSQQKASVRWSCGGACGDLLIAERYFWLTSIYRLCARPDSSSPSSAAAAAVAQPTRAPMGLCAVGTAGG